MPTYPTYPDFRILQGDCMERLNEIEDNSIDAIFADPPYFLSNGGISVQSGKQVCVDKGDWDKGGTPEYIYEFNRKWLGLCRSKLKENGTIWISGTHHNIHSYALPARIGIQSAQYDYLAENRPAT